MAIVALPSPARIRAIQWTLDRPANVNVSAYTGYRHVAANPWHGKWSASVEFAAMDASMMLAFRAFLAGLKGQINTFALPFAEEGAQNANVGVTVAVLAAAGTTSVTITGAATSMQAGQAITIDNQLLMLTKVAGNVLTFQPALRTEAAVGKAVETSEPYAMVAIVDSMVGWSVDLGPVYGMSLEVEEVPGVVGSPYYLDYALALDFAKGRYAVDGTGYLALSSVSGYTYTRSGAKSELNGTASPIAFAANVPGIVPGIGYWSRQSLTNSLLHSQALDNVVWLLTNSAITANNGPAPDGASTADKMTASAGTFVSKIEQVYSGTSAGVTYTESVFVWPSGYRYVWLGDRSDAVFHSATFDLQTGTVVGTTNATASITLSAGGYYRCSIVFARTNGGAASVALAFGAAAHSADHPSATWAGSEQVHLWQFQVLAGNLPDGGPIIVTTTAAAAIGEDLLSISDAVGADANQLFMVTGSSRNSVNGRLAMWQASTNEVVQIFHGPAGFLTGYIIIGGAVVADFPVAYTAGDTVTGVVRRLAGQWRFGIVKNGVLTWSSQLSDGFPAAMTTLRVGNFNGASNTTSGTIKFVGRKLGTFDTDAKVLAAVAEIA